MSLKRHGKRLLLESLGWVLVVAGLAGLVLPGPGLLLIVAGMVLLAREYEWARKRLEPLRLRAVATARQSVQTPTRVATTWAGIVWLVFFGILWIARPRPPEGWFLPESWWLPGGWVTGVGLLVSAAVAVALFVHSWRHHRPLRKPPTAR